MIKRRLTSFPPFVDDVMIAVIVVEVVVVVVNKIRFDSYFFQRSG